ncbi:hypothetical protein [Maricaulis sp.]|uniref:hypothetical protein n=1 Tax=Maricaulis sp. TaxID=1486257 RepID=UPI002B26A380|nr:hypothetical protein [Maricaulis sp.]
MTPKARLADASPVGSGHKANSNPRDSFMRMVERAGAPPGNILDTPHSIAMGLQRSLQTRSMCAFVASAILDKYQFRSVSMS